jgi:hypothetical protein
MLKKQLGAALKYALFTNWIPYKRSRLGLSANIKFRDTNLFEERLEFCCFLGFYLTS